MPEFFQYMLYLESSELPIVDDELCDHLDQHPGLWETILEYQVTILLENNSHGYPDPAKFRERQPTE